MTSRNDMPDIFQFAESEGDFYFAGFVVAHDADRKTLYFYWSIDNIGRPEDVCFSLLWQEGVWYLFQGPKRSDDIDDINELRAELESWLTDQTRQPQKVEVGK